MSVDNAGDPSCAARKPTPEPKIQDVFFCRNAAKFATAQLNDETTCAAFSESIKMYWPGVKYEPDMPHSKPFFEKCCEAAPTPPKGKKYIVREKKITRKIVKASTTVNIDFSNGNNRDKRVKFEEIFKKRAKAKSATFSYATVGRRQLEEARLLSNVQTKVSVDLKFDDDAAAEAGQKAVSASNFATQVSGDLQKELSVTITLTETSAAIKEVEETVGEEVLVDENFDETGGTDSDTRQLILNTAPYASNAVVTFAIVLAAIVFV